MMVATRGGHAPAGWIVVLVLHALLLYFLLLDRPGTASLTPIRYSRLVFIVTPPPVPALKKTALPHIPAIENRREERVVKPTRVPAESPSPAMETPSMTDQEEPFGEPLRMNIDKLVKQAGKADRETRSAGEMQAYGPARDSMEAVMTRAFTAAKLAVPLKWYEAARIELVSAPNDTRRIYQVKTAFGTYCLYYPDTVRDQGGSAGSGQPTMSTCPR
jgi:hypothetical protein